MRVDTSTPGLTAILFAAACTFGSPGGGNGTNVGSEGGDGTTASSPDDGGMEGASASASATGSATSDDASSTSSPVDPDASDDAPATDGDTFAGGSTTIDEPDTSGSDAPIDPTTSGPGSADDAPPPPADDYPPCPSGEDRECGDGNNCVPVLGSSSQIVATVCGAGGCSSGADCAPPSSGNATPVCLELSIDTCMLDCSAGAQCPDGMTCSSTTIGNICTWD